MAASGGIASTTGMDGYRTTMRFANGEAQTNERQRGKTAVTVACHRRGTWEKRGDSSVA
jgi:hypothetical protein